MTALQIEIVACLKDNYAYLVHDAEAGLTAIVDPSEPEPVKEALARHGWTLTHILNTHHHFDHTGGNVPLKEQFGAQIVGPEKDRERIPGIDVGVTEDGGWNFGARRVPVLEIPAHTRAHIAFVFDDAVFTGDTLFAMGCGRLFEGTPATLEPGNAALAARMREVDAARAKSAPTIPSTIGLEKQTNPFLRPDSKEIRHSLGLIHVDDVDVFGEMRKRKDNF
jgi:hydroxyacylglutathione hydrolase